MNGLAPLNQLTPRLHLKDETIGFIFRLYHVFLTHVGGMYKIIEYRVHCIYVSLHLLGN